MKYLFLIVSFLVTSLSAYKLDLDTAYHSYNCISQIATLNGKIWAVSRNGVFRYNPEINTWKFFDFSDSIHFAAEDIINSSQIAVDKSGKIWIAATHALYSITGDVVKREYTGGTPGPIIRLEFEYATVAVDSNGAIWTAGWQGVRCIRPDTMITYSDARFTETLATLLVVDPGNRVWVKYHKRNVQVFASGTWQQPVIQGRNTDDMTNICFFGIDTAVYIRHYKYPEFIYPLSFLDSGVDTLNNTVLTKTIKTWCRGCTVSGDTLFLLNVQSSTAKQLVAYVAKKDSLFTISSASALNSKSLETHSIAKLGNSFFFSTSETGVVYYLNNNWFVHTMGPIRSERIKAHPKGGILLQSVFHNLYYPMGDEWKIYQKKIGLVRDYCFNVEGKLIIAADSGLYFPDDEWQLLVSGVFDFIKVFGTRGYIAQENNQIKQQKELVLLVNGEKIIIHSSGNLVDIPFSVDQKERIWYWVSPEKKLKMYDSDTTISFGIEQGLLDLDIKSISCSPAGDVWIMYGNAAFVTRYSNDVFVHFETGGKLGMRTAKDIPMDFVKGLAFGPDGTVWVCGREISGSKSPAIAFFNGSKWLLSSFAPFSNLSEFDAIAFDTGAGLWVSSRFDYKDGNLFKYDVVPMDDSIPNAIQPGKLSTLPVQFSFESVKYLHESRLLYIQFAVPDIASNERVIFDIFNLQGRRLFQHVVNKCNAGYHNAAIPVRVNGTGFLILQMKTADLLSQRKFLYLTK